ncbi:MAG TPA: DUF6789 family protein [Verrucomicrobiae bacterium]|nr:DUF6789 family protein [Verrucomicrobiae bacterium]
MANPLRSNLGMRLLVFALASLSFACLLGQFYGIWTMRFFGCWILLPAVLILYIIAIRHPTAPALWNNPRTWIIRGAIGGVVAAIGYDVYRLPFVLGGIPLYKPFSRFGELLLASSEPRWLVHTVGWSYHFSNGAALGIMFLAFVTVFPRPPLRSGAVLWALLVEVMLLLTPYATFFGLKMGTQFLLLTISAHLIFGIVLGVYLNNALRISPRDPLFPVGNS